MMPASTLERVLRRDRTITVGALLIVAALAWFRVVQDALGGMGVDQNMADMAMARMVWTSSTFAAMLVMWTIMMAAMMLPGAAPMILLFAALSRKQRERQAPYVPSAIFVLGYGIVWFGFSLLATAAQWALDTSALLSPALAITNRAVAGGVLLGAGIYQFTRLKTTCLNNCRTPLDFLMGHWRNGSRGALVMGARHGLYCLGCCWMLMALLFVGGIMNLVWVAALSLYVLLEKIVSGGRWLDRAAGLAFILWGGAALVTVVSRAG